MAYELMCVGYDMDESHLASAWITRFDTEYMRCGWLSGPHNFIDWWKVNMTSCSTGNWSGTRPVWASERPLCDDPGWASFKEDYKCHSRSTIINTDLKLNTTMPIFLCFTRSYFLWAERCVYLYDVLFVEKASKVSLYFHNWGHLMT